jgi:translation initiation factor IF-2
VTRNAQEIKLDYPIIARINVTGGKVVNGEPMKDIGHILGRFSYIRRWGDGADESTKTVEWTIETSGDGPSSVTVETWAQKAGRDEKTIVLPTSAAR